MEFSPHSLVQTPERVHFRGYARWTVRIGSGFIDLVPARVRQVEQEGLASGVPADEDADWNERADVPLRISPDLPEHLKEVLREEWSSMLDGRDCMTIRSVRKALRPYVLRSLRYRWFNDELHEAWRPLQAISQ